MSESGEFVAVERGDALVVVDLQKDFLPGGSLGVPRGDEVIAPLNRVLDLFHARKLPVLATRDWHPPEHCSFQSQGGPWPPHCIAGSRGSQFADELRLPSEVVIVSKATTQRPDAYSGFHGTELDAELRARGVSRLFVGGLATDYCVLNTVKDGLGLGYEVRVLEDAIRAVNVAPGDEQKAKAEMRRLGVSFVRSGGLR